MEDSQQERASLNLRIPSSLKRQVEEYASKRGITRNAAGIVLLAEGLRAEKRRGSD